MCVCVHVYVHSCVLKHTCNVTLYVSLFAAGGSFSGPHEAAEQGTREQNNRIAAKDH